MRAQGGKAGVIVAGDFGFGCAREGEEPDYWARAVSGWASACGAAGRWVQGRGRVSCSRAERSARAELGELQCVVGGLKRAKPRGGERGRSGRTGRVRRAGSRPVLRGAGLQCWER